MLIKRFIPASLTVLIPLIIQLLVSQPSHSSERYFTVQAGSYTPTGLSYARKNFDTLSQKLSPSELEHLRIGQNSKFYFVRIGKFENLRAAKKVLEVVKGLVPDAYIIRETSTDEIRVVRLYSKLASLPNGYHTVEAGKFDDPELADRLFEFLGKTLKTDERLTLRIEKADKLFSVRVGRFEDKAEAKKLAEKIMLMIDTAVIVKVRGMEEEIVKVYTPPSGPGNPVNELRTGRGADRAMAGPPDPSPAAKPETKKETPEDLMDRISSQYYEQNYEKAAEMLKKGIERWPDNPDLHAWYGATLLNMNAPDKAYDYYKKAAEISPDVPLYHTGAGVSLLGVFMDKAKASIGAFNKALELDPNNVAALEGLGTVYVSIDRKNLARDIQIRLKDLDADAANRLDEMISYGVDWGQ